MRNESATYHTSENRASMGKNQFIEDNLRKHDQNLECPSAEDYDRPGHLPTPALLEDDSFSVLRNPAFSLQRELGVK